MPDLEILAHFIDGNDRIRLIVIVQGQGVRILIVRKTIDGIRNGTIIIVKSVESLAVYNNVSTGVNGLVCTISGINRE